MIELTGAVANYIAKDGQPIYTVEMPGFRDMLRTFDKRYTIPSRKYFSQTALPKLYVTVKEQVKQELSTVTFYSSTTDLWSSIGLKPNMSFTVHFIHSDWVLQSRCLQTHFLPENHKGDNISDALKSTLEFWGLDVTNQVCMTTDNGSNIIKAARNLSCFKIILLWA